MSKPRFDKKIEVPDRILKQLLTASEIRMLKNRWQIIQNLEAGLSIRDIARKVKVGTDTVVRISRMIENKNLKLTGKRVDLPFKTSTPWIFGKNN